VTAKASSAVMQGATDAGARAQAFPAFSLDSDMIFSSRRVNSKPTVHAIRTNGESKRLRLKNIFYPPHRFAGPKRLQISGRITDDGACS
jgi:hypothetical protein